VQVGYYNYIFYTRRRLAWVVKLLLDWVQVDTQSAYYPDDLQPACSGKGSTLLNK